MRNLLFVLLGLLISTTLYAQSQYYPSYPGQNSNPNSVNFPPPPPPEHQYYRPYRYSYENNFSLGVELAGGGFPGAAGMSGIGGIGLLGDYAFSKQVSLEGRWMYSAYTMYNPYYYNGYGYYYPNGYYANQNNNFSQGEFTLGPNFRLLPGRLSPVVGGMLGYAYRYNTSPSYYGYTPGTSSDAEIGGLIGLDYRISKTISAGVDLRYMVPFSSSSNGVQYYPVNSSQPIQNLNYYMGGAYLKFSF